MTYMKYACTLVLLAWVWNGVFAHPSTANAAINAPTIAILTIEERGMTLALEIGTPDIPAFADLVQDGPRAAPSPAQERFFQRGMTIEADGQAVVGKLAQLRQQPRTPRDRITGEVLPAPTTNTPAENVTAARVEYTWERPPQNINIQPPYAKNGANATVGLVVYHRAIPVNDFDYLKHRNNLRLDWQDPWRSAFRGLRLKRYYSASVWASVQLEPGECRVEVVVRPQEAQAWLGWAEGPIDAAGLTRIAAALGPYLQEKLHVQVGGQALTAAVERPQYLKQSLARMEAVLGPGQVPPEAAYVQIPMVFPVPTKDTSTHMHMTWRGFAGAKPAPLPTWVNAETTARILTPEQPALEIPVPVPPQDDEAIARLRQSTPPTGRPSWLPFIAVIVLVVLWWLPGFPPFQGKFKRLVGACVLAGAGYLVWPTAKAPAAIEHEALTHLLLTDVYKAFDYRNEEKVYDALAGVMTGELLKSAYLTVRKTLDETVQAGRVRVRDVRLESVSQIQPTADGGYTADACWWVAVAVTHWGHTHQRFNRYHGSCKVIPVAGQWKFAELTIRDDPPPPPAPADDQVNEKPAEQGRPS
jgi:hypothetical protein